MTHGHIPIFKWCLWTLPTPYERRPLRRSSRPETSPPRAPRLPVSSWANAGKEELWGKNPSSSFANPSNSSHLIAPRNPSKIAKSRDKRVLFETRARGGVPHCLTNANPGQFAKQNTNPNNWKAGSVQVESSEKGSRKP